MIQIRMEIITISENDMGPFPAMYLLARTIADIAIAATDNLAKNVIIFCCFFFIALTPLTDESFSILQYQILIRLFLLKCHPLPF